MNNFHRFQNFEQFSELFSAIFYSVFANLIEKETHATLFWNLSRNPDKILSKIEIRRKATFDAENEKKSEIHFSFAKKCWRIWIKFFIQILNNDSDGPSGDITVAQGTDGGLGREVADDHEPGLVRRGPAIAAGGQRHAIFEARMSPINLRWF